MLGYNHVCTIRVKIKNKLSFQGGSRGFSEVSGIRSRSDQDNLIEQSITLIKQSQY